MTYRLLFFFNQVKLCFTFQKLSDSPGMVAFGTDPVMHHYCLKTTFLLKITQILMALSNNDMDG